MTVNERKAYISVPQEVERIEPFMRKGQMLCPYVVPVHEKANDLKAWFLYKSDIDLSLESFALALDILKQDTSSGEIIPRSLIFSGIISYCKCFTEARGRKISGRKANKVNANEVFKRNKKLFKVHREIKRIRNTYIAHGDQSDYERVSVRVALDPELETKNPLTTYCFVIKSPLHDIERLTKFIEASKFVKDFLEKKIQPLYEEVKNSIDITTSKVYTPSNIGNKSLDNIKVPKR